MELSARSPFSSAADTSRQDAQTWKPLRFLTLYRLTLAGLLGALFFFLPTGKALGSDHPWLYGTVILGYLGFALLAGFAARLRQPGYGLQVFVQVLVDILAIVLLMHASGGLESSLGILLILAVAAGSLLLPGRLAYFFAAVATLAILGEIGLAMLQESDVSGTDLTRAGLLGAALFTTAVIAHVLALRIRESEALAMRRGVDLANLARLNEHVVQRLQSGVLVVDEQERVHLVNDTAGLMLQSPHTRAGEYLEQICPQLARQLRRWRSEPGYVPETLLPPAAQASLQPRFTALGRSRGSATLVFLEDTAALAQQAQQMKLAALGRLTASIAHEIRNPLGAISHAGQLLAESPHLDAGERRLTEIIADHSQRVNAIVENVLQLSRRGQSNPRDIELEDWAHDFVDDLARCGRLPADRVDIRCNHNDLRVSFDPGQLHQIVWNLAHNAIQHGGGRLELRIGLTEARLPCLEVLDEGPGIPDEVENQMFEPFFTTSATGTGLGLYLSRELCVLNDARLSYARRDDQGGRGSRFRITFTRHSV
jgi:two-component system sensor histidine kinase PilS (NtrC family)